MFFRTVSLLAALSGTVSAKGGKTGRSDDDCQDTGYEVWKRQGDPKDVKMKIESHVDEETCMYEIRMSFDGRNLDDLHIPFMDHATRDSILPGGEYRTPDPPVDNVDELSDYAQKCVRDGLFEFEPGFIPTWDFEGGESVGDNEFYTDFGYTMKLDKKTSKATGFKEVTIGASPCGTGTQPFPHYSIHFYTVDTKFRETMQCYSEGGYFCKTIDQQCSEAGRKMQMDGVGLPRCADDPELYANTLVCPDPFQTPVGPILLPFAWTIDGNPATGFNAATPAMGLHGTCPSEFSPDKDVRNPYLLLVQYDSKVIGNHAVFWSGFANGQGLGDENNMRYEWPNTEYNCPDEEHQTLPTDTFIEYDPRTGLTSTVITGPAKEEECGTKKSKPPKAKRKFSASLSGSEQVPPVTSDATGAAGFVFAKDFSSMTFHFEVDGIVPRATHLHCAEMGANGGVAASLTGDFTAGPAILYPGELTVSGMLTDMNVMAEAGCGANLKELAESMTMGKVYVNVHTTTHTGGELRGQVTEGKMKKSKKSKKSKKDEA